jgi:2-iminobutanoate/2-iminopropanoate deaminase
LLQPVRTDQAPPPAGPYTQAWRVGDFIFTAGQGARDPQTGRYPGDDVTSQTHQVLRNIAAVLAAAGASLRDVIKVNAYLADMADFQAFNAAYREHFQEPYPARTTVGAQLAPGLKVEIEAIAYVGPR